MTFRTKRLPVSESPHQAESTPRAGPESWAPSGQQEGAQQQLALASAVLLSLHTHGQAAQFVLRESVEAEVLVEDGLVAPAHHGAAQLARLAGWLQDQADTAAEGAGLGGSSRRALRVEQAESEAPAGRTVLGSQAQGAAGATQSHGALGF